MCLLMVLHFYLPVPSSSAPAPAPSLPRLLHPFRFLLLIILLATAVFSTSGLSASIAPGLPPSENFTLQTISSQQHDNKAPSSSTQLAPLNHQVLEIQNGKGLHRRLGFNLEEAYEKFKQRCRGAKNCRRPPFHILHDVPSGPNPISNYLPS
eukprot:c45807_g1_i1 orf=101-556(+)